MDAETPSTYLTLSWANPTGNPVMPSLNLSGPCLSAHLPDELGNLRDTVTPMRYPLAAKPPLGLMGSFSFKAENILVDKGALPLKG